MHSEYVEDDLWELVSPLIPPKRKQPKGGGTWKDDRLVLNGIIYVLLTGIAWKHLPKRLGWGSGVTAWRRMKEWQKAGVWAGMHREVMRRLRANGMIDLHRVIVDSTLVRAKKGATSRGQTPRIAGKEAANSIFLLTPVGFRSWLGSRQPTSRTRSRSRS
jgi:transposase